VAAPITLRADCARCTGLCCVATTFTVSSDFPIDKPAGVPCPHLASDHRCTVHDRLQPLGFRGCSAFDCFGAGQQVAQHTLPGHDWRDPAQARTVFAVFTVLRELHEQLWHLRQASTLARSTPSPDQLLTRLEEVEEEVTRLIALDAETLLGLDVARCHAVVGPLLAEVSVATRAASGGVGADLRAADLMGRDLRLRPLARATLRGAYLIGADLRAASLDRTDLLGADLRDADLRGADLSRALFVTQMQVNAARGDRTTTLPAELERPAAWDLRQR
jgi:hypothetical protein